MEILITTRRRGQTRASYDWGTSSTCWSIYIYIYICMYIYQGGLLNMYI